MNINRGLFLVCLAAISIVNPESTSASGEAFPTELMVSLNSSSASLLSERGISQPDIESIEMTRFNLLNPGLQIEVVEQAGYEKEIENPDVAAYITEKEHSGGTGLRIGIIVDKQLRFRGFAKSPKGHFFTVSSGSPLHVDGRSATGEANLEEFPDAGGSSRSRPRLGNQLPAPENAVNQFLAAPKASQDPADLPRATSGQYAIHLAIDTDHEFFESFGDTNSAVQHVLDLLLASTLIYLDEIHTTLSLRYLRLWQTDQDPWDQLNNECQLHQFGGHWNQHMTDISASASMMLSGRGSGGIAWLRKMCRVPFTAESLSSCSSGYTGGGLSGGHYGVARVNGYLPEDSSSMSWDLNVFSHELGHLVGAQHTHCWNGGYVDECYGSEPGCFSGVSSLPGPVAESSGTLMSYCHLRPGGQENIAFSFGEDHGYGDRPERVSSLMLSEMQFAASQGDPYWCVDPNWNPNDERTISVNKGGGGRIYTDFYGSDTFDIDCGPRCASQFPDDIGVVLNADAPDNWILQSVDGAEFYDYCGFERTTAHVPPPDDALVEMVFGEASVLDVHINKQEIQGTFSDGYVDTLHFDSGTSCSDWDPIICHNNDGRCREKFPVDQEITLVALGGNLGTEYPFYGWIGWEGACQGRQRECTLDLSEHRYVTANFGDHSEVRVYTTGNGGAFYEGAPVGCQNQEGPLGPECGLAVEPGADVSIEARPNGSSVFIGWANGINWPYYGEHDCGTDVFCSADTSAPSDTLVPVFSAGAPEEIPFDSPVDVDSLGSYAGDQVFYVEVPEGLFGVKFAIEVSEGSMVFTNLLVKQNSPAGLDDWDCSADAYSECEIALPTNGRYYMTVREGSLSKNPETTYQIRAYPVTADIFNDRFQTNIFGHLEVMTRLGAN